MLDVYLPKDSNSSLELVTGTERVRVKPLTNKPAATGTILGSRVVYPDALGPGAHVIHQPSSSDANSGDEEAAYLPRRIEGDTVRYRIELGRSGSARMRNGKVEVVDRNGRMVFQMKRPFAIDAAGRRRQVGVNLSADQASAPARTSAGPVYELVIVLPADLSYPAILDPEWSLTGNLATSRLSHSSTLLPDGRVLVVGGQTWDTATSSLKATSTAEVYDPLTGSWESTTALPGPRYSHSALLLGDGTVLVAGGGNDSTTLSSAYVFTPETETWSQTGSLAAARAGAPVVEGADYAPVVVGGSAGSTYLASAESYDLIGGTWSTAGALSAGRIEHAVTVLPGKTLLTTGGRNANGWLAQTQSLAAGTTTWQNSVSLLTPRARHTATTLRDGRVLLVGGVSAQGTVLASTEVITISSSPFTIASGPAMTLARYGHTATLMENGHVLIVGGHCNQQPCTETSEEFDPATNTWSTALSLHQSATRFHTSTMLQNGKVLAVGGYDFSATTTGPSVVFHSSSLHDPRPCSEGGFVRGHLSAAPASVNLTTEGGDDWLYRLPAVTQRKSGGTKIGTIHKLAGTDSSYGTSTPSYSWTNGAPSATGTSQGGWRYAGSGAGRGFTFSVPAGPALRTLKLWVGASGGGTAHIHAEIPGSCTAFDDVLTGPGKVASIQFIAPTSSDFLHVTVTSDATAAVELGPIALASPMIHAISFETDLLPGKSSYTVKLDNPVSFENVQLNSVYPDWASPSAVPEEVEVPAIDGKIAGYVTRNVDFTFETWNGNGSPWNNYMSQDMSSLDDSLFAWPDHIGTWSSATANDVVVVHGAGMRVGHSPLTAALQKWGPGYGTDVPGTPVSVALDSSVYLIPIQVAAIYSNNYPAQTTLRKQLALFDQVFLPETATITDGSSGEIKSTHRSWAPIQGPLWAQPTGSVGLLPNGMRLIEGQISPDSFWRDCGIQFRLVNYFEKHMNNRHMRPLEGGGFSSTEDRWALNETSFNQPCFSVAAATDSDQDDRALYGIPRLIFVKEVSFPGMLPYNSPPSLMRIEGNAPPGEEYACVVGDGKRSTIAHELGHIVFSLSDCNCSAATCSAMCSEDPGPPTPTECNNARAALAGKTSLTGYLQ